MQKAIKIHAFAHSNSHKFLFAWLCNRLVIRKESNCFLYLFICFVKIICLSLQR